MSLGEIQWKHTNCFSPIKSRGNNLDLLSDLLTAPLIFTVALCEDDLLYVDMCNIPSISPASFIKLQRVISRSKIICIPPPNSQGLSFYLTLVRQLA